MLDLKVNFFKISLNFGTALHYLSLISGDYTIKQNTVWEMERVFFFHETLYINENTTYRFEFLFVSFLVWYFSFNPDKKNVHTKKVFIETKMRLYHVSKLMHTLFITL